jgi:hypothetical protein
VTGIGGRLAPFTSRTSAASMCKMPSERSMAASCWDASCAPHTAHRSTVQTGCEDSRATTPLACTCTTSARARATAWERYVEKRQAHNVCLVLLLRLTRAFRLLRWKSVGRSQCVCRRAAAEQRLSRCHLRQRIARCHCKYQWQRPERRWNSVAQSQLGIDGRAR